MKSPILLLLVFCFALETVHAFHKLGLNRRTDISYEDNHNNYRRSHQPLGGSIMATGFYYVELEVGKQMFRVNIDTGSSTLFVVGPNCHFSDDRSQPCLYAQSYYQGNAPYIGCSSDCSDCQKKTCILTVTYGDGSSVWSAAHHENVTIGPYSAFAPVGVTYLQTSEFASYYGPDGVETYMDGLWGLAFRALSGVPTVIDKLVDSGMPNIFSVCLGSPGGFLVMGGTDSTLHSGTINYSPLTRQAYYGLTISKAYVGANSISFTWPETIIDTGSTLSYIPTTVYNSITNRILAAVASSSELFTTVNGPIPCVTNLESGYPTNYPDIIFNFPRSGGGSFNITLAPSQYTFQCGLSRRAFAFYPSSDSSMAILGDTFIRNFYTVFDRAGSKVGFAPVNSANCNGNVPLTTGVGIAVPGGQSPFSSATTSAPSLFLFGLILVVLICFI